MRRGPAAAGESQGEHHERVAAAGGELLGAAFKLLGELVSQGSTPQPPDEVVAGVRRGFESCSEEDGAGKVRLTFTMPNRSALDQPARTPAQLMVAGQASGEAANGEAAQLQA